jgi:hypothetical protein
VGDVSVVPVVQVGGPKALGALQLGSAQLASGAAAPASQAAEQEPISVIPSASQVIITPAAFAETARVEIADPQSIITVPVKPGGVSGTAQTVPLISPATVAAAIAMGPKRQVATTLPVLNAPVAGVSPAAPKPSPDASAAGAAAAAPTLHEGTTQGMAQPSAAAPAGVPASVGFMQDPATPAVVLPQTPPVFPLAPAAEAPMQISGTRGLLIGFLAGAVLMGLIAVVYFVFGR